MKIVVIGTGYVGLVSGACFAQIGHDVICVDNNKEKISLLENGDIPIYEPGLDKLVADNVKNSRLSFATSLEGSVLDDVDVVLLAVGTPTDEATGRADLQYIFAAAFDVARNLPSKAVIVTKSTVPVGTGAKISAIFKEAKPDLDCEIVSNPEFLREGVAIDDFLKPDRIIVGAESEFAKGVMGKLYEKLIEQNTPILFTNIATAELAKYSSNAFLAMKIAFANEVADICEGVGADVQMVIKAMGMDNRIGGKYMQPGPGYGGSCFPKDTLAMTHIAKDAGFPTKIIEAVIGSNDNRRNRMTDKIVKAASGDVVAKKIAILGLTFKANTDDMRYSPSLVIIPKLLEKGASIAVYDPEGMNEAKKQFTEDDVKKISWCENSYDAADMADILVILTEWKEFADLDMSKVIPSMNTPIIVDLRNILNREKLEKLGAKCVQVGL